MPIVNHLTYNMKAENEQRDDVTLVGFAQNNDEGKTTPIEERLAALNVAAPPPRYWSNGKYDLDDDKKPKNDFSADGYINSAFNMGEKENCHCIDRNRKSFILCTFIGEFISYYFVWGTECYVKCSAETPSVLRSPASLSTPCSPLAIS